MTSTNPKNGKIATVMIGALFALLVVAPYASATAAGDTQSDSCIPAVVKIGVLYYAADSKSSASAPSAVSPASSSPSASECSLGGVLKCPNGLVACVHDITDRECDWAMKTINNGTC